MMPKRWLLLVVGILVLFSFSSRARAADDAKRVVVAEFAGDSGGQVRRGLLEALLGHSEVFVVSLAHAEKLVDGAAVANRESAKTLGKALGLVAVVEGEVAKSGSGFAVKVRVRSTQDGEVSEAHQFRADDLKALSKKLATAAWTQVSPGLMDSKSPRKGGTQVGVRPMTGPKSSAVRAWVQQAIKRKKGLGIVSNKALKGANVGEDTKGAELAAAAEALDASAFLTGKVSIEGKTASVEIDVQNGADGESIAQFTLKGKGLAGLKREIAKELVKKLEGPLERAHPPSPPEEKIAAAAEEAGEEGAESEEGGGEEEAPSEPSKASERPSPLEVGGGIRAASRNFRYQDDLFDSLRAYKLGLAPAGFLWLRWYPVAHFNGGALAHLGLTGGYEQGFALESEAANGEKYSTTSREWFAGLRYRIPVQRHEVGIQVNYGVHSFLVDDDPVFPLVPDVKYSYVRLAADARARVSRVVIGGHFGYRIVSDAGDIQSDRWFPHASVGGVDAGLQAGYEVVDGLDLLVGFDFRRYFYSMNPEPGDARIAGGALDEYIAGWGGFAYRLPGGS